MTHLPRAARLVSRRYRDGTNISVTSPSKIARLDPVLDAETEALSTRAVVEIARASAEFGTRHNRVFGLLEALATSRIEGYVENSRDILSDQVDGDLYQSASLIRSAHGAVSQFCVSDGDLLDDMKSAHRTLLAGFPHLHPGSYRDGYAWIGSIHPASAVFVAPEHSRVPEHMEDLAEFASSDPRSPLTSAAIAHAQFESIHPFLDGNGRAGRMLTQSLLHRHGVTQGTILPLSTGLMSDAHRRAYIDALIAYRQGDASRIVSTYARASLDAVRLSRTISERLRAIRDTWTDTIRVRRDSLAHRMLDVLIDQPSVSFASLTADDSTPFHGASKASVYDALHALTEKGVLTTVNVGWRAATVWYSSEMVDAVSSAYDDQT